MTAASFDAFFHDLCQVEVEEDGLRLVEESITVTQVREDEAVCRRAGGTDDKAGECAYPVQIDIGFGDVVTPNRLRLSFQRC